MTKSKYSKHPLRLMVTFTVLVALALVGLWWDINAGYREVSLADLWAIITGTADAGLTYTIVELRAPRVVVSVLVGAGLALSGCLLQGISRNDMAEPGILGINAGSGVLVAAFIVLIPAGLIPMGAALPLLAFVGAFTVALLDYHFAKIPGRGMSPRRLLLIGVALSTGLASVSAILMLHMSDSDYAFVQNWMAGNIWGATWPNALLLATGIGVCLAVGLANARTLNVMALGYETATGLGVHVQRKNGLLLAVAVGASSLCCAVGGGLSFVGLVCPHLARRLVGPNHRVLIPATLLVGIVLMAFADIISRTLFSPNEIPVGIVAAVIGAPYFLYLLARS